MRQNLLKDARDYQILFLSLFLVLGVTTRDWSLQPPWVGWAIVACGLTQWVCTWICHSWPQSQGETEGLIPADRPWGQRLRQSLAHSLQPQSLNWRSPLITALGLSLLLRGDHMTTVVLAGTVAIASKFFLKVEGKHFLNPGNVGIIAALLLAPDAWVSPGQWGEDLWYGLLFLGAGGLVLRRVGRLETTLAFLISYGLLEALRNAWLGWTWDVWIHRLSSGSLLLFALFMITDPRSIPNHPQARIIWASLIGFVTFWLRNVAFMPTAVFWALILLSPLTLLFDRLWQGDRFTWKTKKIQPLFPLSGLAWGMFPRLNRSLVRSWVLLLLTGCYWLSFGGIAQAFCGFYVSKADSSLYNQASQVVIARDGDRTVLTMANDYQGEAQDFALVVPVPVPIGEDQVHVGNSAIVDRLDAFSAPRLVEYFDSNPCDPIYPAADEIMMAPAPTAGANMARRSAERDLGVTVEASFSVGEYNIQILSAKESDGLETWLNLNGYRMPPGTSQLLQPYIRQAMKFFVAKVNLEEFNRGEFQKLRPLQIAYESPRFMLPIRLGMLNANGDQDLLIYLLSPKGRIELTNYRTAQIPSDAEIPVFVKSEFGDFYKALFKTAHDRENGKVAFLEYTWNMANCDPCSADPLSLEELREAGVFWLDTPQPLGGSPRFAPFPINNNNVYITRLHVRYNRRNFPEDLVFQETGNTQAFQGRYILRHAAQGNFNCPAGREYQRQLSTRYQQEAQTLANLTGWDINEIRRKQPTVTAPQSTPWWRNLWGPR